MDKVQKNNSCIKIHFNIYISITEEYTAAEEQIFKPLSKERLVQFLAWVKIMTRACTHCKWYR